MAGQEHNNSYLSIYGRLLGYVRPLWFAFSLSVVGFLLYSVSNVGFVQLLAYIVDSIGGDDPLLGSAAGDVLTDLLGSDATLNRIIIPLAMVAIVLARGIGSFIGNYFITHVSTTVVHTLRCELFDQLLHLPSAYYDHNSQGHLVSKVTYHVAQVAGAATDAIRVVIREGSTVIGYLAFLLLLNWKLTLIFFLVAPFIAMLVEFAGRRFRRISERIQDSMGDVTHVVSEAMAGYRVVRTFGGADYERSRFGKVSQNNRRQSMKMVVTSSVSTPVIQLIVAIALAAVVYLALDPVLLADMTPGKVIAFITTAGLLAKPIRQLSEVNATIQKGLTAARDIFQVFDEAVEVDDGDDHLTGVAGGVEFRNVGFAYGEGLPSVLQNVSFKVSPGETVALVGRSGSGKSTLASLIPRFYSPLEGEILIDGHPATSLSLDNLRQHIAVVTQEVTLFNDTVARNIAYGGLADASLDDIRDAAQKAYAWKFIEELPDGIDTVVGDDGVLLSGGQRQRLAIARAFLKNAPILILDEATSALDTESEKYIQAALEAVARGRTTFIIAHRLSTIEHADRIIVLDGGQVVEQGTHDDLLKADGYYARLTRYGKVDPDGDLAGTLSSDIGAEPEPEAIGDWQAPIVKAWYSDSPWPKLLSPVSALYTALASIRRRMLVARQGPADVPVIVVGNINVGGTGKSPLVIWLAERLRERGFKPGIVSRGYGGNASAYPLTVTPDSDPAAAGDEAVMIVRRTGCPMVVAPDRVLAIDVLCQDFDCDLVISDDGLQHYAMRRDIEIAVIDAERGLGNGYCLPAGPLREPPVRLSEVDFVIKNGEGHLDLPVTTVAMRLEPTGYHRLGSPEVRKPAELGATTVHAVAGIGNPGRFFRGLARSGLEVHPHGFPDHHAFRAEDLVTGDNVPVVMTEKDAIKCEPLRDRFQHDDYWFLRVDAVLPDDFLDALLTRIERTKMDPEQTTAAADGAEAENSR